MAIAGAVGGIIGGLVGAVAVTLATRGNKSSLIFFIPDLHTFIHPQKIPIRWGLLQSLWSPKATVHPNHLLNLPHS